RDHAHAVAVPDETEPVAVCRAFGGAAVERGPGVPGRETAAKQEVADDPWTEPQPQPGAEVGVQGSGQCRRSKAGRCATLTKPRSLEAWTTIWRRLRWRDRKSV